MTTLVLTVIGEDRAGLVDALAGAVKDHAGSWERSSMTRLGTKFAGIVEVVVADDSVNALTNAVEALASDGLDVRVDPVGTGATVADVGGQPTVELRLVGLDRPGIVHEVAETLAAAGVSIDELNTSTTSAPMSAELLFEVEATLRVPREVDQRALAESLEALADELMVDIDLVVDLL